MFTQPHHSHRVARRVCGWRERPPAAPGRGEARAPPALQPKGIYLWKASCLKLSGLCVLQSAGQSWRDGLTGPRTTAVLLLLPAEPQLCSILLALAAVSDRDIHDFLTSGFLVSKSRRKYFWDSLFLFGGQGDCDSLPTETSSSFQGEC